jgi:glycosyltransferase involved in cell wall biosynthesis
VLIEAMLLERPVIVLAGTAAAELADEGTALASAEDIGQLSAITADLLNDPGARAQLGARARQAALARYRPETVAAQYESIYDELLS